MMQQQQLFRYMYTIITNAFNSPWKILGYVCEMISLIWAGFMTKLCKTRQQGILPSNTSNEKIIQINIFPLYIFSQYTLLTASAGQWNGRGDIQHNCCLQTQTATDKNDTQAEDLQYLYTFNKILLIKIGFPKV